jgi:amidase
MKNPNELSAREAAAAIAAGKLTSTALVEACLAQIDKREPQVRARVNIDRAKVMAAAKACDASPPRGKLHGVPVGVKDIIDTADLPTEYGSPIYAGNRPAWDAACIALVKKAGGIIMGKTVTTEFATLTPNKTTHPKNSTRTPGGSSSGSAAAVADLHVPIGFGTQTAGSLNRPAAFCGVIGFKPSFGAYPMAGIKPCCQSLDTLGTMGRTVDDALLMWDVLHDGKLPAPSPARPRIGLCRTPWWSETQPEVREAFRIAGQKLAAANCDLDDVELPTGFDALVEQHKVMLAYESSRNLLYEFTPPRREKISPRLTALLEQGWATPVADYQAVRLAMERARQVFPSVMSRFDALMMPVTIGEAPAIDTTGDSLFNRLPTLLHVPSLNLNVTTGPLGLPVGLQFIGRYDGDVALLAVGQRIAEILA